MFRRPFGERAMTDAERQARRPARKEERIARWLAAFKRIRTARTVREACAIAEAALAEKPPESRDRQPYALRAPGLRARLLHPGADDGGGLQGDG